MPVFRGFIALVIAFIAPGLALSPLARAVNPPPDGGYANGNTAEGEDALFSLTSTGFGNTGIGFRALYSLTFGDNNTANGFDALTGNTAGSNNTASGAYTLINNKTGNENTATGVFALHDNNTGSDNTANGYAALSDNTTGKNNTATGVTALVINTTGSSNCATGFRALYNNNGNRNTATGYSALYSNSTGRENLASGVEALYNNFSASYNTAVGNQALYTNESGIDNTASGYAALYSNTDGFNNAAYGGSALYYNTSGNNNIALGTYAGTNLTTGSYNIDIGNFGVKDESNTIRIGSKGKQTATFVAGISGATVPTGVGVIVGSGGKLGTIVSSARFKDDIKPMDKASEALLSLKPVTFRYKHDLDPDGIPQFGLVAEEVAKVNPDLVARDDEGKPYTVRYEAVNSMLLNEFLKEHRKGQEQDATIAQLKSAVTQQQNEMKALTASLREQASQIEKVNARLAADQSARRVVVND